MNENFKEKLIELNEIAKTDKSFVNKDILKQVNKIKLKGPLKYYFLQKEKQKILSNLKSEIKNIDDPEYKSERLVGQKEVIVEDSRFFVLSEAGDKSETTFGEILSDLKWGIDYYLDKETVPRNIRKRYLIEKEKTSIGNLLNQQVGSHYGDAGRGNRMRILSDLKNGKYDSILPPDNDLGFIAEIMVEGFFKKISYDNKDLGIELLEADPEQDASKIDFIIILRKYYRGVDIKTEDRVGIQLTTSNHLSSKKREINKIKSEILVRENLTDLIVVSVPRHIIRNSFSEWARQGKRPGGPDKLMSSEDRKLIFSGILDKILPKEEIEEMWTKIIK